jgi:hypothetical protein
MGYQLQHFFRAGLIAGALVSGTAAQAAITVYNVTLNGPTEGTPSLGTGTGNVTYDSVTHQLTVFAIFSGLTGATTASHIHAATASPFTGTAGVATQLPTFSAFPLGVNSGSFSQTLDLTLASSWNPAYVTSNGGTTASAEAALVAAMNSGRSYLNIHTNQFPGGEIRGFLVAVVPEPASWALMLVGFGAIGWSIRHRRRSSLAAA